MVKAVAGSPLRASLPVFPSSPFEPYTCSYTAVRLMGSRLRGRACSTNAPGDSTESGAFSFCRPLLRLAEFLGRSMRREAPGSAGLHLFQELSTLAQPFTHALLLGQGLGRIKTKSPPRRDRVSPSAMRGPVVAPPWMRSNSATMTRTSCSPILRVLLAHIVR